MANQTYRVLELLKRFNNNETICISQLQNDIMWEALSRKTIERDIKIVREAFPETFHLVRGGEPSCYKAITSKLFGDIASADNLSLITQTFNIAQRSNLFDGLKIDAADKAILERKIKDSKDIYLFKSKPFENKSGDFELFKKLESAIYHQKIIRISYQPDDVEREYLIKPYKIVFMNENFYLASEVENEKFLFSPFRIIKIQEVIDTSKTFHRNMEVVDFIEAMQTPFAQYTPNFKQKLIEVIVETDVLKARHFKLKKHLASQTIISENEDGSLVLRFTVTQTSEVEDLIKKWIPHLKVISPLELKDKIKMDLLNYIS